MRLRRVTSFRWKGVNSADMLKLIERVRGSPQVAPSSVHRKANPRGQALQPGNRPLQGLSRNHLRHTLSGGPMSMIPFIDLATQQARIKDRIDAAIAKVLAH